MGKGGSTRRAASGGSTGALSNSGPLGARDHEEGSVVRRYAFESERVGVGAKVLGGVFRTRRGAGWGQASDEGSSRRVGAGQRPPGLSGLLTLRPQMQRTAQVAHDRPGTSLKFTVRSCESESIWFMRSTATCEPSSFIGL